MSKSIMGLIVSLSALALGGNVQADIVEGITNAGQPSAPGATFGTVLRFSTTNLAGGKVGGLGLFSLGQVSSITGTIAFNDGLNDVAKASFSASGFLNGQEVSNLFWLIGNGSLNADSTYDVNVTVTGGQFFQNTGNFNVASGVSDYWDPLSVVAGATDSAAVTIYYDTTSVPEPGTLILTGSALAAGAVGAYFKRRRKTRNEAESTV